MITELTKEQESKFGGFVDYWIKVGLNCEPIDFELAKKQVAKCYEVAGKNPPSHYFLVESPRASCMLFSALKNGVVPNGEIVKTADMAGWPQNKGDMKDDMANQIYGYHDANWLAFYEFFRNECGLVKETEKIKPMIDLAHNCGWWSAYEEVCIIQERHESVLFDSDGRIHNDEGPAIKYRDGLCNVYAIHGVRVNEKIVMKPHKQTVQEIEGETNQEIKRIRIDRFGWANFLKKSKAKVIDRRRNWRDCQDEILYEVKDGSKRIQLTDPSTGREYFLALPREIKTCEEAQNWMSSGLDHYAIHRS